MLLRTLRILHPHVPGQMLKPRSRFNRGNDKLQAVPHAGISEQVDVIKSA